jgi:hypothetical protein
MTADDGVAIAAFLLIFLGILTADIAVRSHWNKKKE